MTLAGDAGPGPAAPLLLRGSLEPPPERRPLRAGPLSLFYEEGGLRSIRLGGIEIIRRIQCLVRDRNWGTVPARLSGLRLEERGNSFRMSYEVEHRQHGIDFFWRGEISGDDAGRLVFFMDGEARSDFLRNRIGFCILHPIRECAGARCRVGLSDGRVIEASFPRSIAPQNPFADMTAFAHEIRPGLWAELRYSGDLFEMEDQRNWTDASFKTFCTPLSIPFPVEVRAGDRIRQSVALSLAGSLPSAASPPAGGEAVLEIGPPAAMAFPGFGLQMASHGEPLSPLQAERLRRLSPSHLRADLHLDDPGAGALLRRAREQSEALGAPLELSLFLTDDAGKELAGLAALLGSLRPRICRVLVFHQGEQSTGERWVKIARAALGPALGPARLGAGTNANFFELNQGRPPAALLDCIAFAMHPQEHAHDDDSVIETLETIPALLDTAREFSGGLPICVGPVTLRKRFNPYATGPEPPPEPGELPVQVDPRQMSLFGAAWTLGCIRRLAAGGAASMTCFETTGWRGVLETDAGAPLPRKFPSIPGGVFPLYHVLADAGERAGARLLETRSSDPQALEGLAFRSGTGLRIQAANLTPAPLAARITGLEAPGGAARVRFLDETQALEAMRSPEAYRRGAWREVPLAGGSLRLDLLPYAVVAIDAG